MKWVPVKKIALLFISLIFLGNVFATNIQTQKRQYVYLGEVYTNPCVIVSVDGVVVEIEQELDTVFSCTHLALVDFAFISLVQHTIAPQQTELVRYYPKDLSPPSLKQLARSHLFFS